MIDLDRLREHVAQAQVERHGLDPARLAEHVAARLDGEADELPDVLALGDLALCAAALAGRPSAVAELERRVRREVDQLVRDRGDDLCQDLLVLLLAGGPDGVPKLLQYAGHAPLGVWLRVIAARQAVRSQGKEERLVATEPEVLEATLASGTEDGELELMKAGHREAFRRAFGQALAALSMHDRLLLRQHVIDGLGIDELGRLHAVHRATAARWLARARAALLDGTAQRLRSELGIGPGELGEVMALVRSRLDLSLSRLLE